jgi:hypothetical protein
MVYSGGGAGVADVESENHDLPRIKKYLTRNLQQPEMKST